VNPHALNKLLSVWPRDGARSPVEFRRLKRAARALGINVDPGVSRGQLRRAVCNLQHRYAASVPWKYQRFLKPSQSIRQQAIKVQPGATIPVAFNGQETTLYVDTARRLTFRGKPWFLELKVKLNTEHLPIILTRETKCECLYCGTKPRGSEDSCRKCGAPLSC
jgi:hypothetical protein